MRVHHLNCTTLCALGGWLMDGRSRSLTRARLVCHCLLLETSAGLVLLDTGYGLQDVWNTRARVSKFFLKQLRPMLREEMTAVRQIEQLGFSARDVRHIVLTHLDWDHAGGLDDFPEATVHLLTSEREDAARQRTWLDRQRYRPQQWSSKRRWVGYPAGEGEPWFGFDAVRDLQGLPPEILFVPLIGHTLGHAGIAVDTGNGWLLMAGDAYFFHGEMDVQRPHCTPGLRFYQTMMEKNRKARLWNQERLRELKRDHGDLVRILCGHDWLEFEGASRLPGARTLPVNRFLWPEHPPVP